MLFDLRPKTSREDLFNRDQELQSLLQAIKLKEPLIVVYGLRRMGKSSLVKVALNMVKQPSLMIDVKGVLYEYGNVSKSMLMRGIARTFTESLPLLEKAGFKIREALQRVRGLRVRDFEVTLEPSRKLSFTEFLQALDSWCEKQGTCFILALDEAQYLRAGGIRYDGLIAWAIDNLPHLVFIVTGSQVGLLRDFLKLEDPKAPLFGRFHRDIFLDCFDEATSIEYLARGFSEARVSIPRDEILDAVARLDGVVGCLTYYGYYRAYMKQPHERALNQVFKELAALEAEELERLIAPSRKRYLAILKAVASGLHRWSEIKGYVVATAGEIEDFRFSKLLENLVRCGYLRKANAEYQIADPITLHLVRSHPL